MKKDITLKKGHYYIITHSVILGDTITYADHISWMSGSHYYSKEYIGMHNYLLYKPTKEKPDSGINLSSITNIKEISKKEFNKIKLLCVI